MKTEMKVQMGTDPVNFNYHSQLATMQDKYVHQNFFYGKKDGVFLDIGAHDGETYSNTLFFEEQGWTGLCVEPMPNAFEKLVKRRKCKCVNAAVSNKNGEATFLQIEGYSDMLSGLPEDYDEAHKKRIDKELLEHGGTKKEITVPMMDINRLLANAGILHVDYCSIDTEGSEEKILSVLNTKEFDIEVFTVENNYQHKSMRKLMRRKGYKLHTVLDCDDVYVKMRKSFLGFRY